MNNLININELNINDIMSSGSKNNISFRISENEYVGLYGNSGSGKSTIALCILGLLTKELKNGTVYINNKDIIKFTSQEQAKWNQSVAWVPQHIRILNSSLKENILFFNHAPTKVSKFENIMSQDWMNDIRELLLNYQDSHISEKSLSGGQIQRIGIARALCRCPKLLILDEFTSALDKSREMMLINYLSQLKGSLTILIVTHRPRPLEICDKLVHIV